jgi:hypothetical protein
MKKSVDFYAKRLGVSIEMIELLKRELRERVMTDPSQVSTDQIVKCEEDIDNGTKEIVYNISEEIRSLDDLIEKCNIDVTKWDVSKYVQNYWGNSKSPHWQVKAWISRKKEDQLFQENFIKFLSNYKPSVKKTFVSEDNGKPDACLILNKQDAHLNKYDIEGSNNIEWRGISIERKVETILSQAKLSNNLTTITYIIGSDEFNSEWTNMTTKGTPQQNTDDYQKSFEEICNHELCMIYLLMENANYVEIIYVPGNHDEYVGWHLIKWLEAYFRNQVEDERITFNTETNYRKYVTYGSTAMMFNHGDVIKPAKLASIFPMEFRDEWSYYDHFYIFTGDKHHELSQDFNGIKFYQIPAFSKAKSQWDNKNGYTCSKAEVTAFLIEMEQGMTNIFKQYL